MIALGIIVFFAIGYFCSSILFAQLISRWFLHRDLRLSGSHNVGATNLIRSSGKKYLGLIAFFLDGGKGYLAIYFCSLLFYHAFAFDQSWAWMIYIPAVSSIIGHSFPIQFFIYACIHGSFNSANHYCGGKSVGTYGGVYMAISWKAALILLTIWFIIMKISRYVSLASICVTVIAAAVLFIPYIGFDFYFAHNWKATLNDQLIVFALYWFGGLMITWRHRTNIVRLLKGTENKTTDRTKQSVPPIPPVSPVN